MKKDTFSFKVKSELFENVDKITLYEILGLLFFNKRITTNNITFITENNIICSYISKLLSEGLNVIVDIREKIFSDKISYTLTVPYLNDRIYIKNLLEKKYEFKNSCEKAAFLRGAFMTYGTIVYPNHDYHLEFVSHSEMLAESLQEILKSIDQVDIKPKIIKRRNNYVVYIKGSEEIINLLTFMGATSCSMDLIQIKMLKELRNRVNRTTNFETANISKIARVSATQIDRINDIKNSIGLDTLPDDLKELAILRLNNPEMSLKDLGENMVPKLSRSGVYHRMQRLLNYKL